MSIPVESDEPSNAVRQTTFFNQIARNDNRVEVLEKSGTLQTGGLVSNSEMVTYVADQFAATILTATAVLDFPSIAAGTIQALAITVTGAATGDAVALGPPSGIEANLMWSGRVSAANTVTIRLLNISGAPIDPASATWRATVFK